MQKKHIAVVLIGLLTFVIFRYIYLTNKYQNHAKLDFGKNHIWAEIADNKGKRTIGLSGRKRLSSKEGMLFIFEYPQRPVFWMKNTYIPLDIIWIDQNNRIVKIQKEAQPCVKESQRCDRYAYDKKVTNVIEVKGGYTKKYSIEVGDKVKITYPDNL